MYLPVTYAPLCMYLFVFSNTYYQGPPLLTPGLYTSQLFILSLSVVSCTVRFVSSHRRHCPQNTTASDHILPDTSFTSRPGADAVVRLYPAAATAIEQSCHRQIRENTAVGKGKGKAVPLQAWSGPEGSRKLRFPDFKTIGTGWW
jgi:hypothetical protein